MINEENTVIEAIKRARTPVQPGDVAQETGLDRKRVFKIITDLKRKGKLTSPRRCYYTLTE